MFETAVTLDPEARSAFLRNECADDARLRADVESLLAADADASGDRLITRIIAAATSRLPSLDDSYIGRQVGPYRLLAELGHGGMGAVYLAERADDVYRAQVAIKLVRGALASVDALRRFRAERQILAALEHPDIARLLDGGVTPDGLPWFAMEYVEGIPIDRYCDDRHLPVQGRLELFCRVCAAVQYAHRSLVVHRDLKPANILVTAEGRPKLLDFGIAKLLAGEGHAPGPSLTVTDERLLTPMYASPEQIRGEPISTATDVYALGALLYVLLTGVHPYRRSAAQPHEIIRAVLEQEPEPPSNAVTAASLAPRLRGDLDAIVLKALEKDPARRYGTAEQLETDVRRHLTGLPVSARPATRLYQARKFVRRHLVGVATAAGVTLLVAGFAIVSTMQAVRVAAERDRAEQAFDYMARALRVPDHSARAVTTRDLLDTAARRIDRELTANPEARSAMMFEMGRAYYEIGVTAEARRLLDSSLALRQRLGKGGTREVAHTLDLLGAVLLVQDDPQAAERAYREAVTVRYRLVGRRHGDVARSLNGLAASLRAQGRLAEAESLAHEALAIDESRPGSPRADVVQSLRSLASALFDRGDYEGAVVRYSRALVVLREQFPDEHPMVASTVLDLATALKATGDQAKADSLFRYGIALGRRLVLEPVRIPDLPSVRERPRVPRVGSSTLLGRTRIAFVSDRDGPDPFGILGNHEVYVMNPDGTNQTRLTHYPGGDAKPAWSPDGSRIAFQSQRGGGADIFIMNADGTEPKQLTNLTGAKLSAIRATWSPDGRKIAFQSNYQTDIYIINVDGTGLRNLTNHAARDQEPDWSPNGDKIAFTSDRDGKHEIYVMGTDGSKPVRLTYGAWSDEEHAWDIHPDWSPDGRKIAFTSDRDGNRNVYVINADGTGLVRLTASPDEEGFPSWSPDGTMIAFHRRVLGHFQIVIMNADGTAAAQLTESSPVVYNGFPSWGPEPRKNSTAVPPAPR